MAAQASSASGSRISLSRRKSYTVPAMARRYSSIGLFGIFGRSGDLRQVDQALRAVDIHLRLVPEAVKLTIASLLKQRAEGGEPAPPAYRAAVEIVGYCMIGAEAFAAPTARNSRPTSSGGSSSP
jgi:hypothetical protein